MRGEGRVLFESHLNGHVVPFRNFGLDAELNGVNSVWIKRVIAHSRHAVLHVGKPDAGSGPVPVISQGVGINPGNKPLGPGFLQCRGQDFITGPLFPKFAYENILEAIS